MPLLFTYKRNSKKKTQVQGYQQGKSPDELKKIIGELIEQNDT